MDSKIKVAEFISRLEFGGAEAMLLNYTTHFQHPEQFDLHIITQDINDDDCIRQFEDAGYTVHIVTHKRKSIAKNVGEVYQVLKQEHFDIAHSHMTLTNFYVLLLAKMLGVRVRISHAHSAFREDNLKAKLAFPILKSLNRLAANVWMACGYNAGVFLYGTDAVDHQKVYMMRNAIDLQRFQRNDKTRQMIREKYAIGDALCVGHVGRFCTPKNHLFVLEIFNAVRKITPASKFLLVGDGELRGEVLAKIKELHLENSVVLTGNVTNTNQGILQNTDEILEVAKALQTMDAGYTLLLMGIDKYHSVDKIKAIYSNVEYVSYIPAPYHLEITSYAHIGIVFYRNDSLNKVFCAPNKIYEYSGFGIPMLANDIPGLKNTVGNAGAAECMELKSNNIVHAIQKIEEDYDTYSENAKKFFAGTDNLKTMKKLMGKITK